VEEEVVVVEDEDEDRVTQYRAFLRKSSTLVEDA
jgi:hypothetical protein